MPHIRLYSHITPLITMKKSTHYSCVIWLARPRIRTNNFLSNESLNTLLIPSHFKMCLAIQNTKPNLGFSQIHIQTKSHDHKDHRTILVLHINQDMQKRKGGTSWADSRTRARNLCGILGYKGSIQVCYIRIRLCLYHFTIIGIPVDVHTAIPSVLLVEANRGCIFHHLLFNGAKEMKVESTVRIQSHPNNEHHQRNCCAWSSLLVCFQCGRSCLTLT